jgi:hypothetical protein
MRMRMPLQYVEKINAATSGAEIQGALIPQILIGKLRGAFPSMPWVGTP